MDSYAPGPGFLLLTVSARGPVTVIYALPSPKQKPLFFGVLRNSVGISYVLGGGLAG